MQKLSTNVMKKLSTFSVDTKIRSEPYSLNLFVDSGGASYLESLGFLNFIVLDENNISWGFHVDKFREQILSIKNQEQMDHLNASCIMNITLVGNKFYLGHWDGFLTIMDKNTMEILEQIFTK